jgi:outer membrane protein
MYRLRSTVIVRPGRRWLMGLSAAWLVAGGMFAPALAKDAPRVEVAAPQQAAGDSPPQVVIADGAAVVLTPVAAADTVEVQASAPGAEDTSTTDPGAMAAPLPPVLLLSDAVAAALAYSPGLSAMQWQAIAQCEQANSVLGHGGLSTEFSILGYQTDSPLGSFAAKLGQGRASQADFDVAKLNNPQFIGSVEYGLKLKYPLFTSGRVQLLADALRLNGEALDFNRLDAQHELISKVIETYFAHDLLRQQIVVLDDAKQTVDELRRMIASLQREGLVVKADVAAADVEVANIADELQQAQANLELTQQITGLLTGNAGGAFTCRIALDPAALCLPTYDEAVATALACRPDLQAMDKQVCAAAKVLDEAIRKRNPTVGVFAEGTHASPDLPGQGQSYATMGAQVTLDLDTAGVIKHEIAQKRATLAAAQLGYQQQQDIVKIEVAQAHSEVVKTHGSMEAFRAQSAKAQENLRIVRNRYSEGLTNYLDLRMAVTTLKESRLRELNSRYGFMLAYMRLLNVTGQTGSKDDPFLALPEAAVAPAGADSNVTQQVPTGETDVK